MASDVVERGGFEEALFGAEVEAPRRAVLVRSAERAAGVWVGSGHLH